MRLSPTEFEEAHPQLRVGLLVPVNPDGTGETH
jgi:hypothetical protein